MFGFEQTYDSDTIVVLDGDEIAFQIAAACEQRGILVTNTTNESQTAFKTRTQMKEFLAGLEVPDGHYLVEDTQVAEDKRNAFATVKAKLQNYRDKFQTNNIEIYLSGEGNFRESLPLPYKYKSNRHDMIRPLLLDDVREYLIKYQGGVVVQGDEADALLAQRAYEGYKTGKRIISSSVDKDLRQASGIIHNPNSDEVLEVDGFGDIYLDEKGKLRGHGRKWLYSQVCLGDKVDGFDPRDIAEVVHGKRPRYGEKQLFKDLSPATTDKEALVVLANLYKSWFGESTFTYTAWNGEQITTDWIGAMQMIWDAAYMRRWEGDKPQVKEIMKKLGVIT